ncbi:biotin--[acetyl-CoA-carboxylase] ligase [Leucobacter ruminantium]|uniref:biotin--[biotin carboxyl-carrier protein] ligase n=1 Tax=Leucobacter ruminantium TaxID=1289170 RepID=A0A939RZD4_9MICO|nr:biotin--[acetyl-CoA-carboxylase] ligase [Leucobacter ruminantium]MBO1805746.1 biotin--[acetyl-CoA-carboxylase] ligase [Leucobacter ruminantium]
MELSRTRELLPRVIWRETSPSTNAELRDLATGAGPAVDAGEGSLPHGTLLATANQTAGRGRLDRGWVTPPDAAVAASLLVRGFGGALGPGWLPLIAGAAMSAALQPYFGAGMRVGLKWPNDVHVRDEEDAMAGRPGLKLVGILCELLLDGSVIVGTGINLLLPEWELPTERATSLLAAGADVGGAETLADAAGQRLADEVIAAYAAELLRLAAVAAEQPAAVRARVARSSLTLGTEVRVHLPGGEVFDGRARALAEDGSLIVDLPTGGELTVAAGDVEHLR